MLTQAVLVIILLQDHFDMSDSLPSVAGDLLFVTQYMQLSLMQSKGQHLKIWVDL